MSTVTDYPSSLDGGLGTHACLGVVVLQSDRTLEHDLARLLHRPDVALHHSRIPNAMEVNAETLQAMEAELPIAAALLPPAFGFDAIAYGCTSGATTIGEARVAAIVRGVHPDAAVTDPMTAAKSALAALGVRRMALLTPYRPEVTRAMQRNFRAAGFAVAALGSFGRSNDLEVARIAPASILDAIVGIGADDACDGVFVSCTNLRTLDVIGDAEARLGKPVVSSNQALAWHLMRLAGLPAGADMPGRLFALPGGDGCGGRI